MKNLFRIVVIFLIVLYIISNHSYTEDWSDGKFINSIDDSDNENFVFGYKDISSEADFWHYSGGYWETNYYENRLRIYDYEMLGYLKQDNSKLKINPINFKIDAPEQFILYLENGGSKENIKFSLESDFLFSKFKPSEIFDDQMIQYKIVDNKIQVRYTPLFNIITKNNIQPNNGRLNVTIPTIDSKFGFPLFAIWKKDGTSLGNTNIGNIADIPEGHAFLDGRSHKISIDTSNDIINPQGDLVSKDIGIWNTDPSKDTITEVNTNDHRIGVGTFANGGAVGMKFILPLRMYYPVLSKEDIDEEIDSTEDVQITNEHTESFDGTGIIKAMTPNASQYNESLGIPSSEEIYTKVFGKSRLTNYAFEKVTGSKEFLVTVKRTYKEKWKVVDKENSTEDSTVYVNKSRSETVSKKYKVNRDYSYYKINFFENYSIDSAKVMSDVLPNGEVILKPKNYTELAVDLGSEINIVSEPSVNSIVTLTSKTVGKNETPSSPDWSSTADNAVGTYQVRNDHLIIDSEIIMDSSVHEINSPAPKDIIESELIGNDVLSKENIIISETKRNGNYSSTGKILYKKTFDYNATTPMKITKDISINSVRVHTPIYSEFLLSSIGDNYNQQINADINDRAIILGMPTKFRYQTIGNHKNILGYGNKDYDNYIAKKEIKFPFDVYYDTTSKEPSKFLKKNTWMQVNTIDTDIYVPIWVDEGSYTIEIRSKAINSLSSDTSVISTKNIDAEYYIIEDKKTVEVVGRLYGFRIRDINDYPLWEDVFRESIGSYELIESNNYPFGGSDENKNVLRRNPKYFLPIAPGSHPTYSNAGSVPLGYKIRFTIETIGNYLKDDQIIFMPEFSFLDYTGNENKAIKAWSKLRFEDKDYLVDLSDIDLNIKEQNPYVIDLGDPYITLKEETLQDISDYLEISLFNLKKKEESIGFADEINLTKYLRSYIGDTSNKPETVDEEKIQNSRQKWYGEYWLPNDTYVVKDNIDLIAYAAENNGLDFSEDIFIKDGFLKVNFKMETLKDPNSLGNDLSYRNSQTNMYQIEGFNNIKEVVINGSIKNFYFEDGDTILYDVNRRRSDDYDSFGTH